MFKTLLLGASLAGVIAAGCCFAEDLVAPEDKAAAEANADIKWYVWSPSEYACKPTEELDAANTTPWNTKQIYVVHKHEVKLLTVRSQNGSIFLITLVVDGFNGRAGFSFPMYASGGICRQQVEYLKNHGYQPWSPY